MGFDAGLPEVLFGFGVRRSPKNPVVTRLQGYGRRML